MDSGWNKYDYITLRLRDKNEYSDPCGYLPQNGLLDFWDALGVDEYDEEKLQPEWIKGNLVPVAPEFPVLSWLIQMQIDHTNVKATDIPDLLCEIEIARKRCAKAPGLAVFNELFRIASLALVQGKGISFSPFG